MDMSKSKNLLLVVGLSLLALLLLPKGHVPLYGAGASSKPSTVHTTIANIAASVAEGRGLCEGLALSQASESTILSGSLKAHGVQGSISLKAPIACCLVKYELSHNLVEDTLLMARNRPLEPLDATCSVDQAVELIRAVQSQGKVLGTLEYPPDALMQIVEPSSPSPAMFVDVIGSLDPERQKRERDLGVAIRIPARPDAIKLVCPKLAVSEYPKPAKHLSLLFGIPIAYKVETAALVEALTKTGVEYEARAHGPIQVDFGGDIGNVTFSYRGGKAIDNRMLEMELGFDLPGKKEESIAMKRYLADGAAYASSGSRDLSSGGKLLRLEWVEETMANNRMRLAVKFKRIKASTKSGDVHEQVCVKTLAGVPAQRVVGP
ncbi:MAG: hypothetical protein LLG01_04070 [Planctomycetaceae bacterium]|nr:hypothetical protein [Planctomycetaceae bacterium]